jgi:transcriptional regulator with PAS, ATPase and Fis domain
MTTPAAAMVTAESGDGKSNLAIRWVFPDHHREVVVLGAAATVFGRDPTCPGYLPGRDLSRRHAEISRDGLLYVVQDLGSRNGVFLNGRQVKHAALSSGDVLRLGEWIGLVIPWAPGADQAHSAFQVIEPDLLVGPRFLAVLDEARQVAATPISVILEGETGTGKERLARAIHVWSRRPGPFVAINCAALPENLAEAELFGHRRGAFTGADREREGHFRVAHGGTMFLDELVELPLGVQAKLLRAIEHKEVVPLGESRATPVDVRIIAAVQAPLQQAIEARRFRDDLYARLDGATLRIPPLRERKEEIAYLFLEFLTRGALGTPPTVSPRLIEQLCLYRWPHNVRELEVLVTRLIATKGGDRVLRRSHLPERIRRVVPDAAGGAATAARVQPKAGVAALDASTMTETLKRFGGNVSRAARALGISRPKAYRLIKSSRRD